MDLVQLHSSLLQNRHTTLLVLAWRIAHAHLRHVHSNRGSSLAGRQHHDHARMYCRMGFGLAVAVFAGLPITEGRHHR